ncbi:hypothetical protein K1T71_014431 [Dendrolimus kikuchii]|uniref:Uncharacterized protein n=1 Tax=Dendrolimus kikuchii TaxID=765133 RepID=A0ACC1CEB3_9NEOP|nr:hypothetical protein K1T71_014431 [Dendrolimus kikuchii]
MPTCAVNVCDKKSNTSNLEKDGVTFHIFPKDTVLKKKWTQSCKRKQNWEPTRTSTICSIFEKKVASLQEILKTLNEKSLIDKEQKLLLQNIGVTNEELLKRQITNAVTGSV